jgi:hypothetical protein
MQALARRCRERRVAIENRCEMPTEPKNANATPQAIAPMPTCFGSMCGGSGCGSRAKGSVTPTANSKNCQAFIHIARQIATGDAR